MLDPNADTMLRYPALGALFQTPIRVHLYMAHSNYYPFHEPIRYRPHSPSSIMLLLLFLIGRQCFAFPNSSLA